MAPQRGPHVSASIRTSLNMEASVGTLSTILGLCLAVEFCLVLGLAQYWVFALL